VAVEDSEARGLKWPLSLSENPLLIGGDLESPSDTIAEWPVSDRSERVTITLSLSFDELLVLASAIDAGRDIAYGVQSIEVWQIWVRALKTMELCQQIADCINDVNSPARQALIDALADNNNPVLPPSIAQVNPNEIVLGTVENPSIFTPSCEPNNIFGTARQIVELSDNLVRGMFEVLSTVTSSTQLMAIVTDSIPIISEAFDFVLWVQATAESAYNASYTPTLRDEIACDLFCVGMDNCGLSIDDIANYFAQSSALPMPQTVEDALDSLVALSSGAILVKSLYSLLWGAISEGQKWLGVDNVAQLTRLLQSFFNDPDSDWVTLCPECIAVNKRLEGYGNYQLVALPELTSPAPVYVPANDWYIGQKNPANTAIFFELEINLSPAQTLNTVTWKVYVWRTAGGTNSVVLRLNGVTVHEVFPVVTGDYATYTLTWSGSQSVSKIAILGGITVTASQGGVRLGRLEWA